MTKYGSKPRNKNDNATHRSKCSGAKLHMKWKQKASVTWITLLVGSKKIFGVTTCALWGGTENKGIIF